MREDDGKDFPGHQCAKAGTPFPLKTAATLTVFRGPRMREDDGKNFPGHE